MAADQASFCDLAMLATLVLLPPAGLAKMIGMSLEKLLALVVRRSKSVCSPVFGSRRGMIDGE